MSFLAISQLLYLTYLLALYTPVHSLHLQHKHLLSQPAVFTIIGSRGFNCATFLMWHELSLRTLIISSFASFLEEP